ncbi:hypothetical protein FHU39_002361 [Flexivirga oryzae]|uniref:Uncharacterized protein n=1 Tax=Flexivirga oryzae TaxID=1794944 RepID=A0A839N502_9MICO|nr:hypothetical protein [Flexivirga oryzae]
MHGMRRAHGMRREDDRAGAGVRERASGTPGPAGEES